MKNVSDKSFRGGTHILCSINFSPKVVPFMTYCGKIITVGENTDDDIIRRTRFACWITKLHTHTHTHTEYVILLAFSTATTVAQMRLNITIIYKLLVLFNSKSHHGQLLSGFLSVGLYSI